jgi:chromosome segregation protein
VTVSDDFREAADRILGRVYLVESLEAVPGRLPQGCTVVTRSGTVFHADGCVEIWRPDAQNATPLARHLAIGDGREQAGALERRLAALQTEAAGLARDAERIAALLPGQRADLERLRRDAAQREGERQSVARDAERAHERLAVVTGELDLLRGQMSGADAEAAGLRAELERGLAAREALVEAVAAQSAALGAAEARLAAGNADLTEHRIREANQSQQLAHHQEQVRAAAARIEEIARQIEGRTAGVRSYAERIEALNAEAAETRSRLGELEDAVRSLQERTEAARRNRASRGRELDRAQGDLAERRQRLDGARERKARLDVDIAEARFRRQSHLDRVHAEYGVTPERLAAEPDPDWPAQPPAIEEVEARVAQLADSIREMGPVNLVAIEEYKELEERLTFLKAQEDDLLKSKDQVLDLIRMINKKSAEMFRTTFEEANRNFERMFTRLFNGGTARLEMVADEEGDPLEAGIEIIARPPGKRPQSISLLSGGERTMTAVSLLFAIYLIKPSPFCILDELDAALDDSNIGRFIQALTDFLVQSQFLIITHNQHTIASSDIVYGITMPERGVSRVVSMRLKDIGARELEIAPEQPAEPPAESPAKPRRPRARKAAKTPAGTEAPVPAGETQSPAADLTQTETPAP